MSCTNHCTSGHMVALWLHESNPSRSRAPSAVLFKHQSPADRQTHQQTSQGFVCDPAASCSGDSPGPRQGQWQHCCNTKLEGTPTQLDKACLTGSHTNKPPVRRVGFGCDSWALGYPILASGRYRYALFVLDHALGFPLIMCCSSPLQVLLCSCMQLRPHTSVGTECPAAM
jgi:hypothetical protein